MVVNIVAISNQDRRYKGNVVEKTLIAISEM